MIRPAPGSSLALLALVDVGLLTRLSAAIPTVPHYTGMVPIQRGETSSGVPVDAETRLVELAGVLL